MVNIIILTNTLKHCLLARKELEKFRLDFQSGFSKERKKKKRIRKSNLQLAIFSKKIKNNKIIKTKIED